MKKHFIAYPLSLIIIGLFILNIVGHNIYLNIQLSDTQIIFALSNGKSHNALAKTKPIKSASDTITLEMPNKEILQLGPITIYTEDRAEPIEWYSFNVISSSTSSNYIGFEFPWLLLLALPYSVVFFFRKKSLNNDEKPTLNVEIQWLRKILSKRLGITTHPQGGDFLENEIRYWKKAGVNIIASALTDNEMHELKILKENELCQICQIELLRFPINKDSTPDSMTEWLEFIQSLYSSITDKKKIVIHSRVDTKRASLIALSILIVSGIDFNKAFHLLAKAKASQDIITVAQKEWASTFEEFYKNSL